LDRIRGWHALGQEAGRRLLLMQTQTKRTPFLATQRYQIASVLSFYTPGQPEVQLLPDRSPAENQYRFWDHSQGLAGQDALFVCEDGWEAAHLGALFTHVENLPPYQLRLSDRSQRELLFFRCDDFQPERGSSFARSRSGVSRP
jgi:hypothetical protein